MKHKYLIQTKTLPIYEHGTEEAFMDTFIITASSEEEARNICEDTYKYYHTENRIRSKRKVLKDVHFVIQILKQIDTLEDGLVSTYLDYNY